MSSPRGFRINNPLNVERNKIVWVGMSSAQPDQRFVAFDTPQHGIRAAAKILQTYQEVHGITTMRGVIERWAPAGENNTAAYIQAVSIWADLDPDEVLDLTDYQTAWGLLRAMTRMELGKPPEGAPPAWYDDATWERGLRMAGLLPAPKPLIKSRTMAGTGTAAVAGSAAVITMLTDLGLPAEVAALLPVALSGLSDQGVAAALLLIAAAGNIYAAWARRDDQIKGRL
jgi:hypothetical protein